MLSKLVRRSIQSGIRNACSCAPKILVTGAMGQIGTDLIPFLRNKYGVENVFASDIKFPNKELKESGPSVYLDISDFESMNRIVVENDITWIIHLGALLSAIGEKNPDLAMKINTGGSTNAINVARRNKCRLYIPSTIGAFGPSTPKDNTPDLTIMRPTTMYGVSKVSIELLGEYFNVKEGLDFRSLRYPGILSSAALPGGGTTDYAIAIFYGALMHGEYTSFLGPKSTLPMMYMPDCLKCTHDVMAVDRSKLKTSVYNIAAWSFSPEELADEIRVHIPKFVMKYKADSRQAIADSWPRTLNDSNARKDWGWREEFSLKDMVKDMLTKIEVNIKNKFYPESL